MGNQLVLFEGISTRKGGSKFIEHHQKNPHIYEAFKKYALQVAQVRSHYSARTIIHVLRFHSTVSEEGTEFKVSNNWSPFYGRMFMNEFPQYKGFFKTMKGSNADKVDLNEVLAA